MKTSVSKTSVEHFSKLTWSVLENILGTSSKKLPPVYFFLAPWSKGSLKHRREDEIALVHEQQRYGQGVALIHPPAAWVSELSQIPEEVSHLFAVSHQPKLKRDLDVEEELRWMLLHEVFGKFGDAVVSGNFKSFQKKSRSKKSLKNLNEKTLWQWAHLEGYFLGEKLAQFYFEEKISNKEIQKFFSWNWSHPKQSKKALRFLYSALNETPTFSDLM